MTYTALLDSELVLEVDEARMRAQLHRGPDRAPPDTDASRAIARVTRAGGLVSYRALSTNDEPIAEPGDELLAAERTVDVQTVKPVIGTALKALGGLGALPVARLIDRRSCQDGGKANQPTPTQEPSGTLHVFGRRNDGSRPRVLLLHGVLSSSSGAFGALRSTGALEILERDFDVWAYSHPTLTVSPIRNATELVRDLAEDGAAWGMTTLVAHSRGGLVAELLARSSLTSGERDQSRADLAAWIAALPTKQDTFEQGRTRAGRLLAELEELDGLLDSARHLRIVRIVRAGSPMRGSHAAGQRMKVALETVLAAGAALAKLGLGAFGLALDALEALLVGFANEAFTPDVLPGLGQMRPDSELVEMLHRGPPLRVPTIALGSIWHEGWGARLPLELFELAGRLFHGNRHDLAVAVPSMASPVTRTAGAFVSRVRPQASVTHLEYFAKRSRGDAVEEVLAAVRAPRLEDVERALVPLERARSASVLVLAPSEPEPPPAGRLELHPVFFAPTGFPDPSALRELVRRAETDADLASALSRVKGDLASAVSPGGAQIHPELSPWVEALRRRIEELGVRVSAVPLTDASLSPALFALVSGSRRIRFGPPADPRAAASLEKLVLSMRSQAPEVASADLQALRVDAFALRELIRDFLLGDDRRDGDQPVPLPVAGVADDALGTPTRENVAFAAFGVAPFELPVGGRGPIRVRVAHGSAHALADSAGGPPTARLTVAFHREGEPLSPVVREHERLVRGRDSAARLAALDRLPRAGTATAIEGPRGTLLLVGIDTAASGGAPLRDPLRAALETWLATHTSRGDPQVELDFILPGQAAFERLTTEEAVTAILQCVRDALQRCEVSAAATVSLFERYRDLATRAAHAVRAISEGQSDPREGRLVFVGLDDVNGFYGERPARAELRGGWARLRIAGRDWRATLFEGRAASADLAVLPPGSPARAGTGDAPTEEGVPLLPPDVARRLEAFDGVLLELDEEAARYPWELSRLQSGVRLAERVATLRLLSGTERNASAPQVPQRRAFVMGNPDGTLAGAAAEADQVEAQLKSARWEVEKWTADKGPARRSLLLHPFGIVHLATHGTSANGGSVLLDGGQTFGAGDIRQMRFAPIMLVLSACQTGNLAIGSLATGSLGPGHVATLAAEALASGVRVFVAAPWNVGDEAARTFMSTLYRGLLDGAPLGIATYRAREAAQALGGVTWAAFQIYGDPELRLREGRPGIVHDALPQFEHGREVDSALLTVLGDAQLREVRDRAELVERVSAIEDGVRGRDLVDIGVALTALGRTWIQLGEASRGIAHLERALRHRDARLDVPLWLHFSVVRLAFQAGQWDERAEASLRALETLRALHGDRAGHASGFLRAKGLALAVQGTAPDEAKKALTAIPTTSDTRGSFERYLWLGHDSWGNEGRPGGNGAGFGRVLAKLREMDDLVEAKRVLDRDLVPRADLLLATRAFDLFWVQGLLTSCQLWTDLARFIVEVFDAEAQLLPRRGRGPALPAARPDSDGATRAVAARAEASEGTERAGPLVSALPRDEYTSLQVKGLGFTIRYRSKPKTTDGPRDAPTHLLLLHGHSSSMKELDSLWEHLSGCHVWSFDFPTNGGSSDMEWMAVSKAYGQRAFDTLELHRDIVDAFVSTVVRPAPCSVRVAGGSLGGNIALWLSRAQPGYVWLRDVVPWSPGSSWNVDFGKQLASSKLATRAAETWGADRQLEFVKSVFCQNVAYPLALGMPQPAYWYWDDWKAAGDDGTKVSLSEFVLTDGRKLEAIYPSPMTKTKKSAIEGAFRDVWNGYSNVRARWHWKVAQEEVAYSHRWFAKDFKGRTVRLLAGEHDCLDPANLRDDARGLEQAIRAADAKSVFEAVPGAGHSLHNEVPAELAKKLLQP